MRQRPPQIDDNAMVGIFVGVFVSLALYGLAWGGIEIIRWLLG